MNKYIFQVSGNIYGLKQAGKIWNSVFSNTLLQTGFQQSHIDPCLFFNREKDLYLLIHVDDGLLIGTNDHMKEFITNLRQHFDIKLEDSSDFLGLEILQHRDSIEISQSRYINRKIKLFGMDNSKSISTPFPYHLTLQSFENDTLDDDAATLYRSMLGSLSFLRFSRPDVLFALNELSRVASKPTHQALKMIKRVFKYLIGTKDYKLIFKSSPIQQLTCYFDASFAPGKSAHSIGGYVIFFGTNPIGFSSYTEKHTSDSSAQAEAYAMHHALKEILFIQNVLMEMNYSLPKMVMYTDSKALYDFTFKTGSGKRSRHWDITLHFMKQYVSALDHTLINLKLIDTLDNIADIFTKALGDSLFFKFCKHFTFKF